ncbi:MAG: hypothetical protein JSW62_05620, partial [Thermoplasmatales archaeon]
MFIFLLSYSILGAGIKYIDDAFDEKTFSKIMAVAITPLLSVIGAYAMIISPASATILLAVLCGVFIKGKIDNYAFIAGLVLVLAIVFFAGIEYMLLPLILLATAAVLDEVGNDFIDKKKEYIDTEKITHKFAMYFLAQRWIMKIAILFLVLINVVPFYFFVAMLFFDYAYLTVNLYSQVKQESGLREELRASTSALQKEKVVYKFGY